MTAPSATQHPDAEPVFTAFLPHLRIVVAGAGIGGCAASLGAGAQGVSGLMMLLLDLRLHSPARKRGSRTSPSMKARRRLRRYVAGTRSREGREASPKLLELAGWGRNSASAKRDAHLETPRRFGEPEAVRRGAPEELLDA